MTFLIFPDHATGSQLAESVDRPPGTQVLSHPVSGRPWLIGQLPAKALTVHRGRDRCLVTVGVTEAPADAQHELDGLSAPAAADALARRFPGDRHVLLSMDGLVRAQGTLSSTRQLFVVRYDGVDIAADDPEPLIRLTGASVDDDAIPARLLAPWTPWPFTDQVMWRGIEAVPMGERLDWDRSGRARRTQWWSPPEPELPLEQAATATRAALAEAIRVRAAHTDLSADLSGGLDSTSLSFLAGRHQRGMILTSWEAANPADEDQFWAARAAQQLSGMHQVMSLQDAPAWFSDLDGHGELEGPFAWIRTRGKLRYQAELLASRGSKLHLTGHGGDELYTATQLFLPALMDRPLRALPYIKAYRAVHRWPWRETVTELNRSESFATGLRRTASLLDKPIEQYLRKPEFGWGIGYRMPIWSTADGLEAARRQLHRTAGEDPQPMSPHRWVHALLQDVRLCGDTIRRVSRWTERSGVAWHAPMIDDAVVEAACSVSAWDVAMPDRYKPLLAEAMRGAVPDEFRLRRTKSEYSADVYAGVRRMRPQLLELCEDLELARRGLVDADRLRDLVIRPPQSSFAFIPLISTLAVESWLRTVSSRPAQNSAQKNEQLTRQGGLG
ncbi:lasso peptide isopeptide bond-forming cyclase [Kribbella albertanoniae]|uniref:asparagine synthase (glutamine-hydrolyzing) n=1 Tax=Kribbella albertanoniae TaxID=1266829 RepID=A0A4R4QC87_9ACTN|nr:asparagine synthase-related protein [Kribbella albertanoniae]TDC32693.1 asparagine synthase [Kribbella albertanoniae]